MYKKANSFAFIVYLAILTKLILFKGNFQTLKHQFTLNYSIANWEQKLETANFTPFNTIHYYLSGQDTTGTIPNILGNIILFIPFGFFTASLFKKEQLFKHVILKAFCVSLVFEVLQFMIAYGTFDVDDLILNTLGAIFGLACFQFISTFRVNKISSE